MELRHRRHRRHRRQLRQLRPIRQQRQLHCRIAFGLNTNTPSPRRVATEPFDRLSNHEPNPDFGKGLLGGLIDQLRKTPLWNQQMVSILGRRKSIDHHLMDRSHRDPRKLLSQGADQDRTPKAIDRIARLPLRFEPLKGHLTLEVSSRSCPNELTERRGDRDAIHKTQIRPLEQQSRKMKWGWKWPRGRLEWLARSRPKPKGRLLLPLISLAGLLDESNQFAATPHPDMLAIVDRLATLRVNKGTDSASEPTAGFDQPSLTAVLGKVHRGLNSSEPSTDDGDPWSSLPNRIRTESRSGFRGDHRSKPGRKGVRNIELDFLR